MSITHPNGTPDCQIFRCLQSKDLFRLLWCNEFLRAVFTSESLGFLSCGHRKAAALSSRPNGNRTLQSSVPSSLLCTLCTMVHGHRAQVRDSALRETSSCGELVIIPNKSQEVHSESVGHGFLFAPWLPVMTRDIGEFPYNRLGTKYVTRRICSPSRLAEIFTVRCHGGTTAVRRNLRHRSRAYFAP